MGVIKGDTRSLDYSSYGNEGFPNYVYFLGGPVIRRRLFPSSSKRQCFRQQLIPQQWKLKWKKQKGENVKDFINP